MMVLSYCIHYNIKILDLRRQKVRHPNTDLTVTLTFSRGSSFVLFFILNKMKLLQKTVCTTYKIHIHHKHLNVIHVKVVKDTEQAFHQVNNQMHGLHSDSPEQLTQV